MRQQRAYHVQKDAKNKKAQIGTQCQRVDDNHLNSILPPVPYCIGFGTQHAYSYSLKSRRFLLGKIAEA